LAQQRSLALLIIIITTNLFNFISQIESQTNTYFAPLNQQFHKL
jgi:hypothetical protein